MGKEVSCRCLVTILEAIEKKNLKKESYLKGIPYNLDYLKNKHERIEWSVYCRFIDNVRPNFTEDEFIEMGRSWADNSAARVTSLIPRLLFTRGEILQSLHRHVEKAGSQYFTCIEYKTETLGPNGIRQILKVKSGYDFCREFFLITRGALEVYFIHLGRSATSINMKWIESGADYEIICAEGGGPLAKLRRLIMWPFIAKEVARELEEANATLLKRYQEIEKTQSILEQQTTQLKTAFEINQVIRKGLDLDLTLDSITRAIVEVAGFKATELKISTETEGTIIEKGVTFGKNPENVEPLIEPMTIEDSKIGEIKVWYTEGISKSEAASLLKQIIPTILLAIHDALTYNTVIDYRKNLERKVEERTIELKEARDNLARTVELLKQAQSARDRFFTNISHEFRTPLTMILGPAKQIMDTAVETRAKENASIIQKNADRLNILVNQLLDLSKLESGNIRLLTYKENIIPIIKGLVLSFSSLAERKNIKLRFESKEKVLEVYIDRDKVEKIITNILSNAFKFTDEGGRIDVSIHRTDSKAEIRISDTGIGIPKERLNNIFDRFYQVDDTHTRKGEGTGIGLALTKELVDLHKGEIKVESEEGKGTTFIVSLQLGKDHLLPEEITEVKAEKKKEKEPAPLISEDKEDKKDEEEPDLDLITETEKPLLLIVEDNSDVRAYIRGHLEESYRISEAVNGNDGIDKALEYIPDLIVSDVMMPEMDGFELCGEIKKDKRTSHIPLILLTAKAASEDKIEGLQTGADDYIMKPFDVKELQVRVKNLIEQRKKLRERFNKEATIPTQKGKYSQIDEEFLKKTMDVIKKHISEPEFNLDDFGKETGMSRTQLHRKVRALTNYSPHNFIRFIRLKHAAELLSKGAGNITEIAYDVGFSSLSHFAKAFKEQFGKTPSKYIKPEK